MRFLFPILIALAALVVTPGPATAQQTPFAPVAVVNGDAITGFDLDQRMRLLASLSDRQVDAAVLRNAAFEGLIEDRLKLQEGKRLGVTATDEMIGSGVKRIAEQRGETQEQLYQRFARAGVTESAVRDSIGAEVVWLEVVRGRFLSRVDPGNAEVDAEIGLMSQGSANVAYRLQEIGLPNPPGGSAEAQARQLYEQLSAGADFGAAVKQYSRAPSAERNGELGWVEASRLPPGLGASVATLQPGQVAPPFPVAAGWSIVKLLEVRQDEAAAPAEVDEETRNRIRSRLVDQRVGRLADGLLQELKRDALIERR